MRRQLKGRIQRAQRGGPAEVEALLHDPSLEVLEALLRNPALQEEHLLLLLTRKDLPGTLLEQIAKNPHLAAGQRIKVALAVNPKTPRLVTISLLKFLYLFDLVRVTLQPGVLPEVKRTAETQIINRLEQLPLGQQVNLARRCSSRVAAALLLSGQRETTKAALENPRMTESELYKLFQRDVVPKTVVLAIARHPKWSRRYDVCVQLLRHPATPMDAANRILPRIKTHDLRVLVTDKRMAPGLRGYLEAELAQREGARTV